MYVPLHRQVGGAPHQAASDESVVHQYHQQGNDVENKEGGHGVDLWVQVTSMGIRGAGDEALMTGGVIESVKIREDGFRYSQDQ